MARTIFAASLVACLLSTALSQIADPAVLGIHEEPARILFYGGSGLLAGLSALTALGSGIYLAGRFIGLSGGWRRALLAVIGIVLIAVVIAFARRFLPTW